MNRPTTLLLFVLVSGALVLACADEVDRAAKRRIFSPEDPPKVVASAKEPLPPEQLQSDPRLVRRVLGIGAAEATERLGPHTFSATLITDWTFEGKTQRLVETRSLVAGPGGVSGGFHATVQNSREQGLEVMRVDGKVYAKNRYGKFRQRLRDRGMAERMREQTYGALGDLDELFRGRIALTPMGTVTHQKRSAWRFKVSLAEGAVEPASAEAATEVELPAPLAPKTGGVDPSTARRQRFLEQRQPVSLDGTLLVDAETSVVLRAKLDGKLGAPGEKGGTAQVRVQLDAEVTGVGQDPKLAAPADFLPDQDKPAGIADALDRFGIPRAGMDAGTPAPSAAEPEDEG